MKKVIIILNLVFLIFTTACNIDEEQFDQIIETFDKDNKIFLNVISEKEIYVPDSKDGQPIKWEYDSKYLILENNVFKIKKDGLTFVNANYLGKTHLYSIKIKNDIITNTVQYNLNFYYSFITDSKKIGKKIEPTKIVFHNTANIAPAKNEIKWLASKDNTSSTSFHFAVDDSGVHQAIPTNKAAYHAGDFYINHNSIGIEIAKSMIDNIKIKDQGIDNATLLIALLMNYYNIDIGDVITHHDASGKYCPHDIFDRYGLNNFYEKIKNLI